MRQNTNIFILLVILFLGIISGACSNDDFFERNDNLGSNRIITKYVTINVKGGSSLLIRASNRQSRFNVTLPKTGIGKISYNFVKGEKMSAFTKVGKLYRENILTCISVDTITGRANFEGNLEYNENDRDVYYWLGGHEDFWGDNFIYLGVGDGEDYGMYNSLLPRSLEGYGGDHFNSGGQYIQQDGPTISWTVSTPRCLFQYGRSVIPLDKNQLSVELNMVTSFATIKIDDTIISKMISDEPQSLYVYSDASSENKIGFVEHSWFNFLTGEIGSNNNSYITNYYPNAYLGIYHFKKHDLRDILKYHNGLISIPLLPGNYKNFKISFRMNTMGNKNYQWSSTPWTFSTVIGDPEKVDDPNNQVYSSNRNFFLGTVDLQEVK